ncbi:MAG: sugar phosphate isomerase/epimerase [Ferruginibacter sp.]|nr:sugar phosphate isomerase/epimerase [Ferruginibacter sp.]
MESFERRKFLMSLTTLSAATALGNFSLAGAAVYKPPVNTEGNRFKISLNAYSFNEPLRNGKTSLEALLTFCAEYNFDAIDLTAYYFPGYPQIPGDKYIYDLKRKAHRMGLEISGTGIRNEFAEPGKAKRAEEVTFVKRWIEVAAKLGAPVIRIFSGKALPPNYTWQEVADWITEDIQACAEYGKQHGVIVAVQNHNDFIKTADEAIRLIRNVNSDWFGLVLDTGSFVTMEPYSEIQKTAEYAVNWQIKEKLSYNGKEELMDLERLFRIIRASAYRGYLPIETLSVGDPFVIVPVFLKQVRTALEKVVNS